MKQVTLIGGLFVLMLTLSAACMLYDGRTPEEMLAQLLRMAAAFAVTVALLLVLNLLPEWVGAALGVLMSGAMFAFYAWALVIVVLRVLSDSPRVPWGVLGIIATLAAVPGYYMMLSLRHLIAALRKKRAPRIS